MTQYQPHTPPKLHNHGFTLVELMVTITVMGIIAAFAIPNMQQQFANKRIQSTTQTIPNAVQYAKSQALINRNLVDIEVNEEEVAVRNVGSTQNLVSYSIDDSSALTPKNFGETLPITLRVSPTGTITKADGTALPTTAYFEICDEKLSGELGSKVSVNAVGQTQVEIFGVRCS